MTAPAARAQSNATPANIDLPASTPFTGGITRLLGGTGRRNQGFALSPDRSSRQISAAASRAKATNPCNQDAAGADAPLLPPHA
ncbi:MAG: hypothetical protein H0X64_01225 [Gemmatimonadaceae bacterium]|nr:hypothetical protein [Gemmatimonadaceae bacterium]